MLFYITSFIFVKKGKEAVFQEFEAAVIPILNNYNGEILYRIRPEKEQYIHCTGAPPYEVHFIVFDSEQDFLNYSQDEKRKTFMHLKEESIQTTLAIKGTNL